MDFTTRPSMVNALARRSEGGLLANRCTITWAGQTPNFVHRDKRSID